MAKPNQLRQCVPASQRQSGAADDFVVVMMCCLHMQ